eukprot:7559472-Pyramimonas_sp.AAC.1
MPSTGHQWITTWVTGPPMEFPGVAGPQTDIPWSGWVYQRTSPGHRGTEGVAGADGPNWTAPGVEGPPVDFLVWGIFWCGDVISGPPL